LTHVLKRPSSPFRYLAKESKLTNFFGGKKTPGQQAPKPNTRASNVLALLMMKVCKLLTLFNSIYFNKQDGRLAPPVQPLAINFSHHRLRGLSLYGR